MKTFKITKKTNEAVSTVPIPFISGGTSGNDIYIVIEKAFGNELNVGGELTFEKSASGNSGEMLRVCEETVEIKNIVAEGNYLYVYIDYIYINPLILTSFSEIKPESGSPENYEYKLFFNAGHNMLPCDIDSGYTVYVRRGENVINFTDLALCYPMGITEGEDILPVGTDCCDEPTTRFNYETMERNSILANTSGLVSGTKFIPESGDQVLFATNPYYYTDEETISGTTNSRINFYECSGETVSILRDSAFMNLGLTFEQDYDAKRMFQEYQVNELFVKKVKDSIIPDFIDLEKVKYAPAFIESSATTTYLATGLTFNLHFRTRATGQTKYTFEDVWHVTDETDTWNGNGPSETVSLGMLYNDAEFVNSSNLIGFLGFTDDDIYNQKNRVKQSFLRLSFYDSIDPLTQNLLYYSTIFLDSGDLFGKYVKRKAWLEENNEDYDHLEDPVVWSPTANTDTCSAVTCQLMVNDEYDMTRSGEGFNLYLFRQDAPIENDVQTIYMKVEFNHAGIGRTVPLIRWPKEKDKEGKEIPNGNADKLTIENYLKTLYIPIEITLGEKGYVYSFPNAVFAKDDSKGGRKNGIVWENDRLVFNLFEPMIETEKVETT